MSTYAWIITKDHLASSPEEDAAGITGPRDAPAALLADLADGNGFTFKMYDGDDELYYTGRMVTTDEGSEESCYGPLGDFGMPNAGCVEIRYPRRPDFDCG